MWVGACTLHAWVRACEGARPGTGLAATTRRAVDTAESAAWNCGERGVRCLCSPRAVRGGFRPAHAASTPPYLPRCSVLRLPRKAYQLVIGSGLMLSASTRPNGHLLTWRWARTMLGPAPTPPHGLQCKCWHSRPRSHLLAWLATPPAIIAPWCNAWWSWVEMAR